MVCSVCLVRAHTKLHGGITLEHRHPKGKVDLKKNLVQNFILLSILFLKSIFCGISKYFGFLEVFFVKLPFFEGGEGNHFF